MNGAMRRWVSVSEPLVGGLEWIGAACSPEALGPTLESAFSSAPTLDVVFLLVRLASTDRRGVERALGVASEFSGHARVCLAIGDQTLAHVDSSRTAAARAGLLLDGIDAETRPASVTHDAIEAIRFRSDFVARAVHHVKTQCALESILSLARNLGVAALAPGGDASARGGLADFAFDWIPVGGEADGDLGTFQRRREHSSAASVVAKL
jgi:hypothetical protein